MIQILAYRPLSPAEAKAHEDRRNAVAGPIPGLKACYEVTGVFFDRQAETPPARRLDSAGTEATKCR